MNFIQYSRYHECISSMRWLSWSGAASFQDRDCHGPEGGDLNCIPNLSLRCASIERHLGHNPFFSLSSIYFDSMSFILHSFGQSQSSSAGESNSNDKSMNVLGCWRGYSAPYYIRCCFLQHRCYQLDHSGFHISHIGYGCSTN